MRFDAQMGRKAGNGTKYKDNSRKIEIRKSACKPGSVENSHSSGRRVTATLERPTREQRGPRQCSPIWSCSGWGLPCHRCYQRRGALLPHLFTLTCAPGANTGAIGGLFSAALSVGSRPPGVTWHPALWSPDFPPHALQARHTATVQPTSAHSKRHSSPGKQACYRFLNP